MIIGLGNDIVDIRRIKKLMQRFGRRFEQRVFSEEENVIAERYRGKKLYSYFAKRFAAKEALSKALGTGIGAGISFQDINISNLSSGKPIISLTGQGAKTLQSITPKNMTSQLDLSMSDEYPLAQAVVIISAN